MAKAKRKRKAALVLPTSEGGAAHQERRVAQARAAAPIPPGNVFTKATRNSWKKEI